MPHEISDVCGIASKPQETIVVFPFVHVIAHQVMISGAPKQLVLHHFSKLVAETTLHLLA